MLLRIPIALLAMASTSPDLFREIDRAQMSREEKLVAYTVTETYTLHNSRFNEPAEMVVKVTYRKAAGKTYQVVSRRGPSFLQTAALDRMLKEEGDMSRGEMRKNSLVTSANYVMKPLGGETLEGRACEVLELIPRKKSPHLLQGKAWVDERTHNLIRIEGRPTASLSFWAGMPQVLREYVEIGQISFAKRSYVMAHNFLLGSSELNITYTGYHIDQLDTAPAQ